MNLQPLRHLNGLVDGNQAGQRNRRSVEQVPGGVNAGGLHDSNLAIVKGDQADIKQAVNVGADKPLCCAEDLALVRELRLVGDAELAKHECRAQDLRNWSAIISQPHLSSLKADDVPGFKFSLPSLLVARELFKREVEVHALFDRPAEELVKLYEEAA